MPDSTPVIGRATQFENVYYAFGHGHVGLSGGAPTGRLIADMVAGRPSRIDLDPYRPDRF
jgi:D-amino-acid dehydrogenase